MDNEDALRALGIGDTSYLVNLPVDLSKGSSKLADPDAAKALEALSKRAQKAGFELGVCSAYRSYNDQLCIVQGKFDGSRAVLDADEKPLDISKLSVAEKVAAVLRFSALPGFSRHHFGTDFDIYASDRLPCGQKLQLTCREYAYGSYFFEFGEFLKENLAELGFIRPFSGLGFVAAEPWHISYFPKAERMVASFDYKLALLKLKQTEVYWADAACEFVKKHRSEFFS